LATPHQQNGISVTVREIAPARPRGDGYWPRGNRHGEMQRQTSEGERGSQTQGNAAGPHSERLDLHSAGGGRVASDDGSARQADPARGATRPALRLLEPGQASGAARPGIGQLNSFECRSTGSGTCVGWANSLSYSAITFCVRYFRVASLMGCARS